MKPSSVVEEFIAGIEIATDARRDQEILREILQAHEEFKRRQALVGKFRPWAFVRRNPIAKLATATAFLLVAVLSIILLGRLATPVWALEQTIAVLKELRAVHMVVAFPGSTAEIWMRANEAGTQSTDLVMRDSQGAVTWVKDGSTYHYDPGPNIVYFEPAVTAGATPWLGTALLETLSKADGAQIVRGKDPATGRERATLLSSLSDAHGLQSFVIEFDVASKLPVSIRQWPNLDRSGPPAFHAFQITYYEDLPASVFDVHIPGQPAYVEKPLAIPEENSGLLGSPHDGMSAAGLTQQEAGEKIVREVYQTVIGGNLEQLRRLCPLLRNWGDEFLRTVILRTGQGDQIVEVVRIGPICKTGHSKLGPIVVVPVVVRRKDGTKMEDKMIVQFRQIGGQSSCVVHGPYGLSREVK